MKQSILKRFPELTEDDVLLRDDGDGNGIYIDVWNSAETMPTMEQVYQWVDDDAQLPKPKTELEELKSQQQLIQNAIDDLILGGML